MSLFSLKKRTWLIIFIIALALWGGFLFGANIAKNQLIATYQAQQSGVIYDRNGQVLLIKPNAAGYYAEYTDAIPPRLAQLLIQKEDKYFYYHQGINPVSALRALKNYLTGSKNVASSTLTQQLVKILLPYSQNRTIKNKLIEAAYAISLETFLGKKEILLMYLNAAYFGNQTQGIQTASRLYFGVDAANLDEGQILKLIATISNPSNNHPFSANNQVATEQLAKKLNINSAPIKVLTKKEIEQQKQKFSEHLKSDATFELQTLDIDCPGSCVTTIDSELNGNIREILKRNLLSIADRNVTNGAVMILSLPDNEVITLVGSPDPTLTSFGYQINMLSRPRPIGSTIKPFIYLKAFEKNLRPYTLVDDREYKYTIGTGFALYPKNYDYKYRGEVTLHYALTNSLNVPAVKTLEYVGIENFNDFLRQDLGFIPVQPLENYQLGIALGVMETDIINLAHYFTIFPNQGYLKPLKLFLSNEPKIEAAKNYLLKALNGPDKKIAEFKYVQLVNKVLSDRQTGIEQFGQKSDLNLTINNYAVKTGTSKEFLDSWTIGYTPDFLVAVWVGNSSNEPMENISGQMGAGKVWQEVMNYLINSEYNKNTAFNFDQVKEFTQSGSIEYGLAGDDYQKLRGLLENQQLILSPHDGDAFLLEPSIKIPLQASQAADWFIDDVLVGHGQAVIFSPPKIGRYEIRADDGKNQETIEIVVEEE